jgi:GT2 family glycosyltransferase
VTLPAVGVVVVNYNGGDDTLRCLRSLAALDWPADRIRVVLVDNASSDGVADRVAAGQPAVEVVRSPRNLGFAGGCNLGFDHLAATAPAVDHVALLNPDATVEPAWLRHLVTALESAPDVGAVAAKVLLEGEYVEVEVAAPVDVPGRGDRRPLGVQVSGATVDGVDAWRSTHFVSGTWGPEHGDGSGAGHRWTGERAVLRVPAGRRVALRLSAGTDKSAVVTSAVETECRVGPVPAWCEVDLAPRPVAVINSAGAELRVDGYGADRGYLAADDGSAFEERDEVFAWSGSAVLLSGRYLAEVGHFAPSYFMYYEDFDLSWRGRLLGWRYLFEPGAVVRHRHAASSGLGSALFEHYVERNRLLTVVRNAPAGFAWRAVVRYVLITLSYARRDLAAPLLRGRRPTLTAVRRRGRSFAAFARHLPGALRQRRRIRRRGRVDDAAVLAWMTAG